MLCWAAYLALFLKPRAFKRSKRSLSSVIGILFQLAGVFLVFFWRRPASSSNFYASAIAVLLAIGAVWFSHLSLRSLGEQWSLVAGVTERHQLICDGPYAVIRHPLYACFFTLTFATALVWTHPGGGVIALTIFLIGVWIRIRTEERLLRQTFGAQFDEYAKRVPALIPMLYPSANVRSDR